MSDDLVKRLGESRAVWKNAMPHPTDLEIEARARITALEAENAALKRFVTGMAMCALTKEHTKEERRFLLKKEDLLHQRDADIAAARAIIALLKKEATK